MKTIIYNKSNNIKSIKQTFKQLTRADKYKLEVLLLEQEKRDYSGPKLTCQYLANILHVSKSTISGEIKRGSITELDGKGHTITHYHSSFSVIARQKSIKRSHYKTKLSKDCNDLYYIQKQLNKSADVYAAMIYYKLETGIDFPVCEKQFIIIFAKR